MLIIIIPIAKSLVGVKGLIIISIFIIILGIAIWWYYSSKKNTSSTGKSGAASNNGESFRLAGREDLCAGYHGQSALKTKKLLEECTGMVLFIDEAHSLYEDDRDIYGKEALNVICQYMTEFPNRVAIWFGGYPLDLARTIFRANPGLMRRVKWKYYLRKYNGSQLFDIFNIQLEKKGWKIKDKNKARKLFIDNVHKFRHNGGSTENLIHYAQLEFADNYPYLSGPPNKKNAINRILDYQHIETAIEAMESNDTIKTEDDGISDDILRTVDDTSNKHSINQELQFQEQTTVSDSRPVRIKKSGLNIDLNNILKHVVTTK